MADLYSIELINVIKEKIVDQLGFEINTIDNDGNLYHLVKNGQTYCRGDINIIHAYISGIWDTIYTHHRNIMNGNLISVWMIDDVKNEYPNLTDDQCISVLQSIKDNHDANIGINWDVIESTVSDLYPDYE